MKTVSVNVQTLCVPCENRCRYCLLSYDGKLRGADYARSEAYAGQFYEWLKANRPDLSFAFYFGYSMEHPALLRAIDFARSIGSPTGEFLQLDGLRFRSAAEVRTLLRDVQAHGIKLINLTFYGDREYHDRFAARQGDFDYLMLLLRTAVQTGLPVTTGIPVTGENAGQLDKLVTLLEAAGSSRVFCFVPHREGRGAALDPIRLTAEGHGALSGKVKAHFNREIFRPEQEWLAQPALPQPEKRVVTLSLTPENIGQFEAMPFGETIRYLEGLDDAYYAAVPAFEALADRYGDPAGQKFYSARDLYMEYQRRFIREQNLQIYNINDERQHFSRRFA